MAAERQQLAVTRAAVPHYVQLAAGFAQPLLQAGRQRVGRSPRCARLVGVPHLHLTCAHATGSRHSVREGVKKKEKKKTIWKRLKPTFRLKLLHFGVDVVPALRTLRHTDRRQVFGDMLVVLMQQSYTDPASVGTVSAAPTDTKGIFVRRVGPPCTDASPKIRLRLNSRAADRHMWRTT